MKLVGSRTEQDIRAQLIISHKSLFEDEEKKGMLNKLLKDFPNMETAYVLHWIPEQEEDFYKVLINDSLIVDIELNKLNQNVQSVIESKLISQYKVGLSKLNQIRLAVAIDMAQKDLRKQSDFI